MSNVSTRRQDLDLLKIIAMIGVISLHTNSLCISSETFGISDILYMTAVIAIPLFFTVSGYLLIGRDITKSTFRYSASKILGIIRFCMIAAILTAFILAIGSIAAHRPISFLYYLRITFSIFFRGFLQGNANWMLWYFGSMIIIYILYPSINALYAKHRKFYHSVFIILLIIVSSSFALNLIYGHIHSYPFESRIKQTFRLWNWLFYFLLGGELHLILKRCAKIDSRAAVAFLLFLMTLNVLEQLKLRPIISSLACEYFYGSPITMLEVIAIFIAVSKLKIENCKLISELSPLFLPVYYFHVFVIGQLVQIGAVRYLSVHFHDTYGAIIFVLTAILTIGGSWLIMKFPGVKTIFKI